MASSRAERGGAEQGKGGRAAARLRGRRGEKGRQSTRLLPLLRLGLLRSGLAVGSLGRRTRALAGADGFRVGWRRLARDENDMEDGGERWADAHVVVTILRTDGPASTVGGLRRSHGLSWMVDAFGLCLNSSWQMFLFFRL